MTANQNYRVDIELVECQQSKLTQMQAKLNQWITKGELIKYEMIATSDYNGKPAILFNICRIKQKESE